MSERRRSSAATSFKHSQHLSEIHCPATRGVQEKSISINRKEKLPLRGGRPRLATSQHRRDPIAPRGSRIEDFIANAHRITLGGLLRLLRHEAVAKCHGMESLCNLRTYHSGAMASNCIRSHRAGISEVFWSWVFFALSKGSLRASLCFSRGFHNSRCKGTAFISFCGILRQIITFASGH